MIRLIPTIRVSSIVVFLVFDPPLMTKIVTLL
jgi:hypothetical protein